MKRLTRIPPSRSRSIARVTRARSRRDIQPAFGSDLFAFLRNQRYLRGFQSEGDVDHLVGACRLEIEISRHRSCERLDIGVLNVPAVLAKVSCDSISPRGSRILKRLQSGSAPIRVAPVSAWQHGLCSRTVVDVLLPFRPPFRFAPTFVESRVKKTLLALFLLTACSRAATTTTTTTAGPVGAAPAPPLRRQRILTSPAARHREMRLSNSSTQFGRRTSRRWL